MRVSSQTTRVGLSNEATIIRAGKACILVNTHRSAFRRTGPHVKQSEQVGSQAIFNCMRVEIPRISASENAMRCSSLFKLRRLKKPIRFGQRVSGGRLPFGFPFKASSKLVFGFLFKYHPLRGNSL